MKWVMLLLMCVLCSLQAQAPSLQVNEVVPKAVYLEAGGKQITAILRGSGLASLRQVQVKRMGQTVQAIYTQLGSPSDNRRTVSFIASPGCPLAGDYQVTAITMEGGVLVVPLPFNVVKVGDPKATQPDTASLAESAEVQAGRRIVVAEPLAPVITGTIPSPLLVPPDGKIQKILIQGRNLQEITEVRVRKAGAPARYKGSQGLLPFRMITEGVEVDVVVAPATASGSQYILDLMIKKYLAASASMAVGYPANGMGKKFEEPVPEGNRIQLTPTEGH